MKLPRSFFPLLLVLFCLGSLVTRAAGTDSLPRYKFTPGQVLNYEGQSEFKYTTGTFFDKTRTKIWVVRQNKDGGWHVIVWTEDSDHRVDTKYPVDNGDDTEVDWTRGDLAPDGTVSHLDSMTRQPSLLPEIIPLPRTEAEFASGWARVVDLKAVQSFNAAPGAAGASLVIRETGRGGNYEIYKATDLQDYTFDRDRGLITQDDLTTTQGYGFIGKTTGRTVLKEVTTADAAQLATLEKEYDATAAVRQSALGPLDAEGLTPQQLDDAGRKALERLKTARAALTLPEFQSVLDNLIKELPDLITYDKQQASHRQGLLNAPAPDWKTTDLAGRPHALADYKGKVVVLDFWYRGCGWCMLAMPQVKEAAEHYEGKPVAFLAMSTDSPKSKDADFVVKHMGLTYPTLYAKKIADDYKIQAFPTLLILDQNGVIRQIHEGYAADLRDQIEKSVDALLEGK